MRLPASQYSVLDAKKIERLDDDTFICYVGGLNFLGFVVEPVLTVSVIVQDRGPVVKLLHTEVASLVTRRAVFIAASSTQRLHGICKLNAAKHSRRYYH